MGLGPLHLRSQWIDFTIYLLVFSLATKFVIVVPSYLLGALLLLFRIIAALLYNWRPLTGSWTETSIEESEDEYDSAESADSTVSADPSDTFHTPKAHKEVLVSPVTAACQSARRVSKEAISTPTSGFREYVAVRV